MTGGDSGIGKGIAKQLAIDGADVYIFGRSQRKLQKAVKEFRKEGLGIKAVKGNVSSLEDGKKALSHIISKSGKLNILVNSAGIISQGGILDGKTRDWEKTLQINLHGVYLFTKIMIPELIKNKGNCIVNISSVCSKRVTPTLLAYSVSKAALDMFSKCLALELAPYLVRVNTVNPELVDGEVLIEPKLCRLLEQPVPGEELEEEEEEVVPEKKEKGKYNRVHLVLDIPPGKLAEIVRTITYLKTQFADIDVRMELTAGKGKITASDYEDKIKEAISQAGIRVEKEEAE